MERLRSFRAAAHPVVRRTAPTPGESEVTFRPRSRRERSPGGDREPPEPAAPVRSPRSSSANVNSEPDFDPFEDDEPETVDDDYLEDSDYFEEDPGSLIDDGDLFAPLL